MQQEHPSSGMIELLSASQVRDASLPSASALSCHSLLSAPCQGGRKVMW